MKPAFTSEVLAILLVLVPTIILTGIAAVAQLTRVIVRQCQETRTSVSLALSTQRQFLSSESIELGKLVTRRRQEALTRALGARMADHGGQRG